MGFPRHGVMGYEAQPDTFPTRASLRHRAETDRRLKAQSVVTQKLQHAKGKAPHVCPPHIHHSCLFDDVPQCLLAFIRVIHIYRPMGNQQRCGNRPVVVQTLLLQGKK